MERERRKGKGRRARKRNKTATERRLLTESGGVVSVLEDIVAMPGQIVRMRTQMGCGWNARFPVPDKQM